MANGFGHCRPAETRHVPFLGVAAEADDGFDQRQLSNEAGAPSCGAFPARRQVRSLRVISRKAEAHGNNCELPPIIEQLASDAEPAAQTVPGGIVERETRF